MGLLRKRQLSDIFKVRKQKFASSGELNFKVSNSDQVINDVFSFYRQGALSIDNTDGLSLSFDNWRFNLRKSNTEPLVRLNVEGKSGLLKKKVSEIIKLLNSSIK